MRLFFIVFIVCSPILLSSQTWKAAEWITSDNERVTGWVKIPTFLWASPSSIKLKIDKKAKPYSGSGVVCLYLLEGLIYLPKHALILLFNGNPFDLSINILFGKIPHHSKI